MKPRAVTDEFQGSLFRPCRLVTFGQALHWFDFERFFSELRQVLSPGGLFAAWTYADDHVTPDIDALKQRIYSDLTAPYWPPERRLVEHGYADISILLQAVEAPKLVMQADWIAEQFLAYLRSGSGSQCYRKQRERTPWRSSRRSCCALGATL